MNSFLQRHHKKLFYTLWAFLGIVQAASTQLIDDEAYYWVYSRFPAWGYFDHPPLTALLIKTGYAVFPNELGVRLLNVLLNLLTILIIETLTERKNPFIFYAIALSISSLQIIGFLAVPDNALLFFTALFFYVYHRFLCRPAFTTALLLGMVMALLLYTKYHGLLVIVFTLLSNFKLLSQPKAWVAALFAILLYSPHLYWQWQNNWVSFRYHLFESNVNPYKITYTTDYLLGQLLLAGPFAGFLLLPAAFLYRTQNKTESALKTTLIGIYVLFFISSFRGRVEANWPAPALIPLIILSHRYISSNDRFLSPIKILAILSLVVMLASRIYMIVDIGPDNSIKNRFHAARKWVPVLNEKTGGYPVVFNSSYQKASQFWFYSKKPVHNMHYFLSRRSNYNFWPTDLALMGRSVYCAADDSLASHIDSVHVGKTAFYLWFDSSYVSFGKARIIPGRLTYSVKKGEPLALQVSAQFPYPYDRILAANPGVPTGIHFGISKHGKKIKEIPTNITAQMLLHNKTLKIHIHTGDLPPGHYVCRFGIKVKNHHPTHNSDEITLHVK